MCAGLGAPVIVKEVGWGIADDLVTRLFEAGVAAVDVAGAGGTSWSEVERHRMSDPVRARVAASFAGWGIPTTEALIRARSAAPGGGVLIASGGVRNGIDVAKALTLGADSVGIAGPLVRAAAAGDEALDETVTVILEELRLAMFCVGAARVVDLRTRRPPGPPRRAGAVMARTAMSLEAADAYCRRAGQALRELHGRLTALAAVAAPRPDQGVRVLQVHR